MSYLVSLFAAFNRPSRNGAAQRRAHTTAEEMMGLL